MHFLFLHELCVSSCVGCLVIDEVRTTEKVGEWMSYFVCLRFYFLFFENLVVLV